MIDKIVLFTANCSNMTGLTDMAECAFFGMADGNMFLLLLLAAFFFVLAMIYMKLPLEVCAMIVIGFVLMLASTGDNIWYAAVILVLLAISYLLAKGIFKRGFPGGK